MSKKNDLKFSREFDIYKKFTSIRKRNKYWNRLRDIVEHRIYYNDQVESAGQNNRWRAVYKALK